MQTSLEGELYLQYRFSASFLDTTVVVIDMLRVIGLLKIIMCEKVNLHHVLFRIHLTLIHSEASSTQAKPVGFVIHE